MNIYAQLTSMNIFERLSRLDFDIHKIDHQKRLTVDRDIVSH
jgi:hypothetical protein